MQHDSTKTRPDEPLDVLFIGEHPLWPLDQGFCVHGYNMATALDDLGLRVGIATHRPPPSNAPQRMADMSIAWPQTTDDDLNQFLHGWRGFGTAALRRRLARYQGRELHRFAGVMPLIDRYRPTTVIGLGQHAPLMLRALRDRPDTKRVWYAADEPIFFQLSCMRREPISALPDRMTKVALYAALETLFVRGLDGAIGVNPRDSKLLRWLGGVRRVVTIPNGVDMAYFSPNGPANAAVKVKPRSLVFWGRMDFEPNIDAVTWFAHHVWPTLRHRHNDATWQIVGKKPHPTVQALSQIPGIQVLGAVDDIRPYAKSATATILPVRCGGGIKNKLLEAAAMGRPIVASPKALHGLDYTPDDPPALQSQTTTQWVETIERLWSDPALAAQIGDKALRWVRTHHTWRGAAVRLMAWLNTLPSGVPAQGLPPHRIRPATTKASTETRPAKTAA